MKDGIVKQEEKKMGDIVTDPHDVQEIRNSIAMGINLLRSGKDSVGKPLSTDRRFSIRRSILNSQAKIGEDIKINPTYTIEDVTPEGYGSEL